MKKCLVLMLCLFIGVMVPVSVKAENTTTQVVIPTPVVKVSSATRNSVKISWMKLPRVSGYVVYRSTKKKSGYQKIKKLSSSKRSYTNKKLSQKKTYYYRVYALQGSQKSQPSNWVSKVKVRGNYKKGTMYGPALSSKGRRKLADKVAFFVNTKITPGMTQEEKVGAANDYICKKCKYSTGYQYYAAYGCLVRGKAQCTGYSMGMKALCDAMGIGCKYVSANAKSANPNHVWNMVKVKGRWYIIDVQSNDVSGFRGIYLWSSTLYKKVTGMRWNEKKYPKCPKNYKFKNVVYLM